MPPVEEQKVNTSVGPETLSQTVTRAKKLLEPVVTAEQLTNDVTQVQVPEPQTASIPSQTSRIVNNVTRDVNGFISAQTEEAKRLQELQDTYGALSNEGSLSDLFKQQREAFGATPEVIQELKDIDLQLADMQTASDLTKVQIQGADGQTIAQSQREVTQEDREAAVRSAGLAARAAVLRGNIETANTLARDAVNIAYQDRQLKSQNLINQIEMVQGQVDEQTAQLLEQEKRQYEADLAKIQEVKDSVANAMVNGATQAEMAQLTDPTIDDEAKIALANSITARGAGEMRNLDIQSKQSNIRANDASAAAAWALADQRATETLLSLAEAGDQNAINELGLTMSDNTQPTADEIAYARQYAATGTIPSGMPKEISFGRIAELASDLPKAEGTLVSKDTGVVPDGLSATDATSFDNLYNAINTDLPIMLKAWEEMNSFSNFGGTGLVGGIASTISPSEANTRFETAKADFLAKLLVARSGAAVTEQEYARYAKLIPGAFNTIAGIGTSGTDKLNNLEFQMKSALDDKLNTRGLSIYGYSEVNLGGEVYKVGEIITNEYGATARVNPDGTLTEINSL